MIRVGSSESGPKMAPKNTRQRSWTGDTPRRLPHPTGSGPGSRPADLARPGPCRSGPGEYAAHRDSPGPRVTQYIIKYYNIRCGGGGSGGLRLGEGAEDVGALAHLGGLAPLDAPRLPVTARHGASRISAREGERVFAVLNPERS